MKDIEGREDIMLLVNTFYDRLQEHSDLDYLFNTVAQIDWVKHLPKMYDFWETLLFHKQSYKGNPMKMHVALDKKSPLEKAHFDAWLQIFEATVNDLFVGEKAELAKQRANSVAMSISLKTVFA